MPSDDFIDFILPLIISGEAKVSPVSPDGSWTVTYPRGLAVEKRMAHGVITFGGPDESGGKE